MSLFLVKEVEQVQNPHHLRFIYEFCILKWNLNNRWIGKEMERDMNVKYECDTNHACPISIVIFIFLPVQVRTHDYKVGV